MTRNYPILIVAVLYSLSPGTYAQSDVGRYPAGLYFIQAQTGQEQKVLSFLK